MKKIYIVIMLLALFISNVQAKKLKLYKATNGITYHAGDTLLLGQGSMPNGSFKYLQQAGLAASMMHDSEKGDDQFNMGREYSGRAVIIKGIYSETYNGVSQVTFIVKGQEISGLQLYIEDAIISCEIKACK